MSDLKEFILKAAARSISAHNVQPFRFRFHDSAVDVFEDPSRHLPIADAHGKDLQMSLGALFETLRLALSEKNYALSIDSAPNEPHLLARWTWREGATADPLAKQLEKRFSYRGFFKKSSQGLPPTLSTGRSRVIVISSKDTKKTIAKLYDQVNLRFLSLPGYVAELYSWLRFSKSHPRWEHDGLSAESMGLSGVETLGASVVLKPGVFSFLNSIGLAGVLLAEAPRLESAHAVAAIVGPRVSHFESGREFLRGWLALTEQGLYGAPLSLLTDDAVALETVARAFGVGSNEQIYNVLRVGTLPPGYEIPAPARRPVQELLYSESK